MLWNPISSVVKSIYNIDTTTTKDIVCALTYNEKRQCYLIVMFIVEKIRQNTTKRFAILPLKNQHPIIYSQLPIHQFDDIDHRTVIIGPKVYFLGITLNPESTTPRFLYIFHVESQVFTEVILPTQPIYNESKIVKYGSHVALLCWYQRLKHPFQVHIWLLKKESSVDPEWRELGLVGRIAGDETLISLHNDSLITVYEVSDEWVYYNSEPGRIYYAYSFNNILRKTLLRDEADFNVQDVFDYSNSLYFPEI
ncbi:hypothetical protein PIB30_011523 [Stylosanthes scabra]|uniref:F-box associated domain-containing protein n=1 Tax=Stylosanthes scabra TaxID=79078 RepID=A0ABU6T6P2_9FABA|nr:hypothetical protein [Stylosanthes scabra]